ncbi:MAG: AAA family ATPase [Parcubacteria group bacterium]
MKFPLSPTGSASPDRPVVANTGPRVSYTADAFEAGGPSEALRGQFPHASFKALPGRWTSPALGDADVLIVAVDAARSSDVETLCANLRESGKGDQVIVLLQNPDLGVTRRVVREGAFDVLPGPASDAALVGSLERLFNRIEARAAESRAGSEVIAMLKAGGGVGATSIAVQLAAIFAQDRKTRVCLADLDVQSGSAAVYLDLQDTVTVSQVLAAGKDLGEIGFYDALSAHPSGVRVLGDPQEFMPLEAVTPALVENLIAALRREFDVVLIDLPPAWTAWTDRVLRAADRIVLVTHLSVPHANLTRRQLNVLASQRLDSIPLTLVCNAVGQAPAGVSVKAMEKAIGRHFDAVVPEDRKVMDDAINQGVAISTIRRGTKLEKALIALAQSLRTHATAEARRS